VDKLEATHVNKCIISTQKWKNEHIISWNNNIISPWRFIAQESRWKNLHHKLHKNVLNVMWQNSHWVLCYMILRSTMCKQDKRKYAYKLGRFSEPPQSITLPKLLKIRSSKFRMFIWIEFKMFIWLEFRMFIWIEFIMIMNINPKYFQK